MHVLVVWSPGFLFFFRTPFRVLSVFIVTLLFCFYILRLGIYFQFNKRRFDCTRKKIYTYGIHDRWTEGDDYLPSVFDALSVELEPAEENCGDDEEALLSFADTPEIDRICEVKTESGIERAQAGGRILTSRIISLIRCTRSAGSGGGLWRLASVTVAVGAEEPDEEEVEFVGCSFQSTSK